MPYCIASPARGERRLEITLRSGARFTADFYHCTECSLHFVHPDRFMRAIDKAVPERRRSSVLV